MPNQGANPTVVIPQPELLDAWLGFTGAVRPLLAVQPDDRPLDQYLEFRNASLRLVESGEFLEALQQAWVPFTDAPKAQAGRVLLLELAAFPRAVEVAKTTAATEAEKTGWLRKLLGKASTVAASVDDILEGLPDWARAVLKLFREAIALFQGKEA